MKPSRPSKPDPPAAPKGRADPKRARRSRRRRWAVRLLLGSLLLASIPVIVALHYTRPHNLKPLLEGLVAKEIGGDVTIGRAQLSWGGELTLDALWVDAPGLPKARDEFAKIFEAERLAVQLDYSRLWRGELRVRDIRLERPQLHIIEDLDTGELNLEMLEMAKREDKVEPFRLVLPPAIEINAARVRFAQVQGGKLETLRAMRLEGELTEDATQKRRYDFALRQYDAQAQVDATLTGQVDTAAPSLDVTLTGFRIDSAHRQLVPAGFRTWWDQLRPTGQLPNLTLRMDADINGRLRFDEAVLELHNVAMTPPYAEFSPPPAQPPAPEDVAPGSEADTAAEEPGGGVEPSEKYAPRMTEVSGRFVVSRDAVRVENLTGNIEGVRYHASGRWGFEPGAAGEMAVSTDPFTLDKNPRFIAALPMLGVKLYDRLQPSGRFQASTRFERAEPGQPIEVSGAVRLLGAQSRYYKFPFPIENLRGVVTFNRDTVRLENLTGDGPNGGTITLRGEISPPADGAAVRIAVEARAIPFDELVMDAFKPERRKGVELFFDQAMYTALIEEGVIRSSDAETGFEGGDEKRDGGENANESERAPMPPVFDLGGRVNVDVLIDRAYGKSAKYKVTTTIDAAGVRALFKHWPYPLIGRSGKIVVEPGQITLDRLVMESPTGGRGTIHGRLLQESKGAPLMPDLRVEDADLPIDKLLLHSIRTKQRRIVADLHPAGRVVGGVTITRPDLASKTQWRVEATVVDGTLRPNAGEYRLTGVAGGFKLGNTGLQLQRITGRRGEAELDINGFFNWAKDDRSFRLDVAGRALQIEPALLDLLPSDEPARKQLASRFEKHRPAGGTDARLIWESYVPEVLPTPGLDPASSDNGIMPAPPARSTYTLEVRPKQFGLDYKGDRLEFSDMEGRVTIRPTTLDIERLRAAFTTGTAEIDGLVGLGGGAPSALTLTAEADAHCPYTRKFLPDVVVELIDKFDVAGAYRMTEARLLVRPEPSPDQAELEFEGELELTDARLKLGVPIEQIRGTLGVIAQDYPGQTHPQLSIDLRADALRVADRRVAPLTVRLANSDAVPEFLEFDQMLGGVYGGVLFGTGRVPLASDGRYRLDLTLSDAAANPLLKPKKFDPTYRSTRDDAEVPGAGAVYFSDMDRDLSAGQASASLSVAAPLGDEDRRHGRGAVSITDAELFDHPVGTALLRVTNFSLPSGAPLRSASSRFLIDGDTLRFDELSVSGANLTIAGAGTMRISDTELNLVMVPRNAQAPRLGPVSDLWKMFKDELLAIRVTGPLKSPRTRVTSLRGLQSSWDGVFGDSEE